VKANTDVRAVDSCEKKLWNIETEEENSDVRVEVTTT
jgi:hypothetical protein